MMNAIGEPREVSRTPRRYVAALLIELACFVAPVFVVGLNEPTGDDHVLGFMATFAYWLLGFLVFATGFGWLLLQRPASCCGFLALRVIALFTGFSFAMGAAHGGGPVAAIIAILAIVVFLLAPVASATLMIFDKSTFSPPDLSRRA